MESLAQLRGSGKALHVPAEMLPEFDGRATSVGLVLLGHMGVFERDSESLLDARVGTARPSLEEITRLIEYPWLSERAAGDHDARATRLIAHPNGILRRLDVTVSEYRDRERVDHSCDFLPARRATVHLRACPGMQGEYSSAGVLAAACDPHRVAHVLVPPAPDLTGDGQVRASD